MKTQAASATCKTVRKGVQKNLTWSDARLLVILLISGALVACGGGAPKKEELVINIQAAEDVNPDSQGRPSPIVVHILELKSVETFNSLNYVSLTDNSGAALGQDRLNGSQTVIAPGGNFMTELELDAGTSAIGIVAGYRDIDNASWRQAVPIAAGATKRVTVQLGQFQMTTSTED
jgi:type VI secretion system protein VasD